MTFAWPLVNGNNLFIDNITLINRDTVQSSILVEFDLSWENSWRISHGPANWDAAWVFIKFRKTNGDWQHGTINYVNGSAPDDGHLPAVGSIIRTPNDGRGVFIYRAQNGSGANDWKKLQLRWNYGTDGVLHQDKLDVDVYGIEMVYMPEGSFTVGGGNGGEVGKIYQWSGPFNFTNGYSINSENTITVGTSLNSLHYFSPSSENAGDQLGPIPAQFPKGFSAFYCMKYEVSQLQWVSFFNSLTETQRINNDITDLDHRGPNPIDRNSVDWDGDGAYTVNPFTPLSFPLWGEVLAYCDWAGLRPMTEFEFVKACRGPIPTVANEYAWGSANIIETGFTYELVNKGSENELVFPHISGIGNANWINSAIFEDGPYRCGIFAASAKEKRREDTGATFYGIMEMSGNLSEMAVTIGTPEGRAYIGTHGDGLLDLDGEANQATWPPITGEGGGLFGGSWFSLEEELQINERRSATIGNVGYFNDVGFRCVRNAP